MLNLKVNAVASATVTKKQQIEDTTENTTNTTDKDAQPWPMDSQPHT